VGGPLFMGRSGALTPPLRLKSGLDVEWSGSKSQMSEAMSGVQKSSGAGSRRSGNGAVSGTPVNVAER